MIPYRGGRVTRIARQDFSHLVSMLGSHALQQAFSDHTGKIDAFNEYIADAEVPLMQIERNGRSRRTPHAVCRYALERTVLMRRVKGEYHENVIAAKRNSRLLKREQEK